MANNISYEVVEDIGVIGHKGNGYKSVRLRMISWNGRPAKYDLRMWVPAETGELIPSKGFTLEREDLETLRDLIDMTLDKEGEEE